MISVARHLISYAGQMLRQSAVRHVGILTIAQYLATGLGVLTTVIAARILGPEGYGQAALILAFPSLLRSVGSFKSITVSTRYLAAFRATEEAEQLKAISKLGYGVDLAAFLGVFLIVLLTGRWVAGHFYGAQWMFWLMVLYAGSFPLLAFRGGSFAILTAFEEFRLLSLLYILDRGLSFLFVVTLLLAGYGVVGMVLGMAIGNVLIGLFSLGIATSHLVRNGVGTWWKGSFKSIAHLRGELFSFFGWNYLMTTLGGAITQAPVMFLGAIRGAEEAGFFRLALSLMTVTSFPTSAAGRVAYPRLSGRWAGGESDFSLKQSLKRWTRRGGLSLGFGIALMIPFLPWIVPLLFGEGYRPMVPGVQVLFVAAAVGAFFFWLNSYYYATGRVAIWTKDFALYTTLVLAMGWFAIQQRGFFGMAMVFSVGKVLFLLLMAWKVMSGALGGPEAAR